MSLVIWTSHLQMLFRVIFAGPALPNELLYFEKTDPYFLLLCQIFMLVRNITKQQHSLSHTTESLSELRPLLK